MNGHTDCPTCVRTNLRWTRPEEKQPHYVYRLYGADGRLVYVGCSINPLARIEQHRATAWWFHEVVSQRLIVFHTREHALMRERAAIGTEHPRFNVKGRWQHRSLWTADDYCDYHLAIVMSGGGGTSYNATHLKRVVAEARQRYGIDLGDAA